MATEKKQSYTVSEALDYFGQLGSFLQCRISIWGRRKAGISTNLYWGSCKLKWYQEWYQFRW